MVSPAGPSAGRTLADLPIPPQSHILLLDHLEWGTITPKAAHHLNYVCGFISAISCLHSLTIVIAQSTVLARLQALFPSSGHDVQVENTDAHDTSSSTPEENVRPSAENTTPHFLKVRIVTWNMHDSLPKGELDDLLGTIPPYEPQPEGESDRLRFPNMNMEDCHPYHIVVVAGQECPTVSGIPMGLAAAFKHKDERHKEEEKKQAKQAKNAACQEESNDRERLLAVPLMNEGNISSASSSTSTGHPHPSGWSWILEEWFCHGLGEQAQSYVPQALRKSFTNLKQIDGGVISDGAGNDIGGVLGTSADFLDMSRQKTKKLRERKGLYTGPYELLTKERLMGIYIAVFVYRDVKPLVRGVSDRTILLTVAYIPNRLFIICCANWHRWSRWKQRWCRR